MKKSTKEEKSLTKGSSLDSQVTGDLYLAFWLGADLAQVLYDLNTKI